MVKFVLCGGKHVGKEWADFGAEEMSIVGNRTVHWLFFVCYTLIPKA